MSPTIGRATIVRLAAVVLAFALVSLLVATGSRAAFSDTTDNTGNSLSAGTVDLVDDDSATVLFNVSNMTPGDSSVNCIVVTYQGTIVDPAAVKLYSSGFTDSADLANWLNITIEEGTGGSFGTCAGFANENTIETGGDLIAFNTTHTQTTPAAPVSGTRHRRPNRRRTASPSHSTRQRPTARKVRRSRRSASPGKCRATSALRQRRHPARGTASVVVSRGARRMTRAGTTASASVWPELRFYLGLGALFWTSLSIAGAIWVIAPTLLLGWNPVAISSNSMAPAFHRGDIVIADAPQGDIDVGSVVVFEDPSRDGLLTHRLVGVTLDGTYVTRGDANAATDSTPLAPEAVRGVGRLLVPSVGLPLVWVDEGAWLPFGLWAVLTLVALWAARFALDSRYDPWRERGETSGVGRAPARRGRRQLAPRAVAGALASVMAHSVAAVRTRRSALPSPVAEDHAHEPLVVSIDASVATAEELLALGARLEDHPTTAQVSLSRVGRATARFEITTTDRAAVAELLDSTAGPGEWRVPDDRDAERPARMRHDGFTQPAPNSDHGEPLTLFIDASFAAVQGLLAFGAQIEEHPTTAAVALSRGGRPAARFEIVTNDPAAVVELLDSIVGPQEWHAPDPLHAAQLARAHARRNRRGPSARVAVIATLVASLCGLAIAAEPSLALFGSATGSSGNALAADTLDPPPPPPRSRRPPAAATCRSRGLPPSTLMPPGTVSIAANRRYCSQTPGLQD